ncbi:MAG: hypothetical protein K2L14_08090 [Duncaniella sp.]|nr:hypothetical protein [Duncaniella sp.]
MRRPLLWYAILMMFIVSNSVFNIECQAQYSSHHGNFSNTSYTASKKSGKTAAAKVKKTFFESALEKAEKGDSKAMIDVGFQYQLGHQGGTRDIEKAKYWYNKAIQAGNVDGYSYMASLFESDDEEKYIEWLRKGVENTNGYCFVWLHNAYKRGSHGLRRNMSTAGELLLRAGEKKLSQAFFYLGLAYRDGSYPNIQKNNNKAIYWFKKALDDFYARTRGIDDVYLECLIELGSSYEPALHVKEYETWLNDKSTSGYTSSPQKSIISSAHDSESFKDSNSKSYIYTKSGRGQSQNTGQWTDAIGSEECVVQFTDDGISVNGMYQPYVKTSGIWKVYGGTSMGFGGSNTTFYYYVDGNKNMKQVCESSFPYGFDTFVYPMSRNGDPTPMGNNVNNGGYVNSNGTNNNSGTGSAKQPARQFKCAYCNGSGRIERNDNAPASFGQTRANKKCNECGKIYDPTVFNHYHVQCGHCGGTGNAK